MKKTILLFLSFLLIASSAFAVDYCADASMKGAWYMDGTDTTPNDCTSNANDCTTTGTVTKNVTGKFATAVDFIQNNNARLTCDAGTSMDDLISISVGTYLQPDTDGANDGTRCNAGMIITKSNGWVFCMQTTAQLRYTQSWSGGTVAWTTTDTPLTFDGTTWQHVAATYAGTGTTTDPIIYLDGASRTVGNQTPFGTRNSDAANAMILGLEGLSDIGELDSRMDEPYVYSGILTSTQINDIKDNGLTPATATRRVFLVS